MNICETHDNWREQHAQWSARRNWRRADRARRQTQRDHGLRRRMEIKLARNAEKAATPDESEMTA